MKDRLHHLFVGGHGAEHLLQPTRLQQFFHFWWLAGQSFVKNRLPVRAASLAYTTLLALVPMLAVVVGITSSLLKDQSDERIEQFVDELVQTLVPPTSAPETSDVPSSNQPVVGAEAPLPAPSNELVAVTGAGATPTNDVPAGPLAEGTIARGHVLDENVQEDVARRINGFIRNTRSGTLGTVGTAVLIFMAISMLIRVEDAFNELWGVLKGRSLFMRLVLYWTVISLAPVMLLVAMGLASGPHLKTTERLIGDIPLIGWLLFQLLPVFVLCLAFSIFYMLMPNTRVRWQAALVGGLVAALLWHLNNSLSALYFSRVATNWKIYGGLGLIPVFMIGLYFAWMILLFGGQVSYAWQNRVAFFHERITENINQRGKEFVALRLMTAIGAAYQRGAEPPSHAQMSAKLGIPPRLTLQVLQTLVAARLITEVSGAELAYVPARPIELISCYDILQALRVGQGSDLALDEEPLQRQILGEFQRINDAEQAAASSVSVYALAERANKLLVAGGANHSALNPPQPERT